MQIAARRKKEGTKNLYNQAKVHGAYQSANLGIVIDENETRKLRKDHRPQRDPQKLAMYQSVNPDSKKKDHKRRTCKERPEPKSGGGGGRSYIPWCNKK